MRKIAELVLVVDADGTMIASAGYGSPEATSFRSDDASLVKRAKEAATLGLEVEFHYGFPTIRAGYATPLEVLAALLATAPGRSRILDAPKSVLDELERTTGAIDPTLIY